MRSWERTLEDYLGVVMVTGRDPSASEPDFEIPVLREGATWKRSALHEETGATLRVNAIDDFFATDASGRVIAAWCARRFTWVDPAWRGRGIMSEIYVILDEIGRDPPHYNMSEMGFAARKAAHAKHVTRALAAGLPVPSDVRAQYALREGRLRLVRDRTPDMANAHARAHFRAERVREIAHRYRHTTPFGDLEGLIDAWRWDTRGVEGFRITRSLIAAAGRGEIRMTIEKDADPQDAVFQIQIGSEVLDATGVRPVSDAQADLEARGETGPDVQIIVSSAFELLDWIDMFGPDMGRYLREMPETHEGAPFLQHLADHLDAAGEPAPG